MRKKKRKKFVFLMKNMMYNLITYTIQYIQCNVLVL